MRYFMIPMNPDPFSRIGPYSRISCSAHTTTFRNDPLATQVPDLVILSRVKSCYTVIEDYLVRQILPVDEVSK